MDHARIVATIIFLCCFMASAGGGIRVSHRGLLIDDRIEVLEKKNEILTTRGGVRLIRIRCVAQRGARFIT
jgi:hypothetical protein